MIVRVATFNKLPEDDRDWVIDSLRGVPGVRSAYHAVDPGTKKGLSISFYDDEAGARAGFEAISARAQELGHEGQGPDVVERFDVVRFVENS